jgi:hypothetical protein
MLGQNSPDFHADNLSEFSNRHVHLIVNTRQNQRRGFKGKSVWVVTDANAA